MCSHNILQYESLPERAKTSSDQSQARFEKLNHLSFLRRRSGSEFDKFLWNLVITLSNSTPEGRL